MELRATSDRRCNEISCGIGWHVLSRGTRLRVAKGVLANVPRPSLAAQDVPHRLLDCLT